MGNERPAAPISAWLVVGLGFLALAFSFSARAALGLAMPIWTKELGWTREFISFGGALALIVMAAVAPFAGNFVDRRGPRPLLAGGMVAVGLGALIVSAASSRWQFLIGFAGVAGVGFGMVAVHVVATAVAGCFERGRGAATGLATAGATGGQLVVMPLFAYLLEVSSWRPSFTTFGAISLALGILIFAVLGRGRARATENRGQENVAGNRILFLLRNPVFHVLFWSFLICGFTTTGVIETHLLPFAATCGFAPLPSATAYGVLSGVNLCGMIASGWLSDRVNRPMLLGGIYLARALCFVLLIFVAGDYRLLILFSVLFGLVDYSTVPVTASLVADRLGLQVMGLAMGLISAGHAAGGALGAFLGGWLYDRLESYEWVWLVAFLLAAIAGTVVLMLRETRGSPARLAAASAG